MVTKTSWFWYIVCFALGAISVYLYENYNDKLFVERQLRQIDSLRIEIAHKDSAYSIMKRKSDSLDVELEWARNNVKEVVRSFPVYKRPEIVNPDSATRFVLDFIRQAP